MTERHLLLLRTEDVKLVKAAIERSEQHKYRVYHFSAEIQQELKDTSFANVCFLGDRATTDWQSDYDTSDQVARNFDSELSYLRENHTSIDNGIGWCYLNFQFIFYNFSRLKKVSKMLGNSIPSSGDVIVPWCISQPDYYFDSEVYRSVAIDGLRGRDNKLIKLVFGHYRLYRPMAYALLPLFNKTSPNHIVHLPTAHYAVRDHIARLETRRDNIIDIESPYFDVPVWRSRANLRTAVQNLITPEYANAILKLTREQLEPILDSARADTVARRLVERENFQLNLISLLRTESSLAKVTSLDVTDHDTGMQGPLMTFARERGLKVTVWPHSTVSVAPFPSSKTTQKKSCVVSERNEYVRLGSDEANAEIISFPRPSRRDRESINILLLFNHLEDSAGVTMIDVVGFKRAYKKFKLYLLGSGIKYKVRHKPKHGYIDVFEDSADPLATGNLDKWFEWAGLCVSFGHISTALIGFASAGCYCAHIGFGELSRQERAICPPTVKLFQHESYSDNFADLETWMHLVFGDKYRNSAAPDEGD